MGALALPAQELARIRVEVNLVNVPFSVRDARGKLVEGLTRDEVEILEDGVAQKITHFSGGLNNSLALGLISDVSGSQEEFLKEHRRDLLDFLKTTMRPGDQTFLLCFANQLRLVAPWTSDRNIIGNNLKDYQKRERGLAGFPVIGPKEERALGTAFYDAVYHAATELMEPVQTPRRALILFSDGEDNSSAHHMLDAIEAAQRAGAPIFALRYTELKKGRWSARNKYGKSVLERLALETGGAEFDASEGDNLRDAFREIGDILRSSYDLGYSSSNPNRDGSFRKIQIRVKNREVRIRHKTGYFAR